ncbi:hypothetical protein MF1_10210 [Bartonella quintana]|uniref:hypothetical protein n=1 Tax=Bartonella quintana TaxID=803 RepID=UPI0005B3DC4C|nr:hypothetical protein [Bartonella quintana]BBL53763.1 hypothetical protein MF1_10210 [Bartonella quintana]
MSRVLLSLWNSLWRNGKDGIGGGIGGGLQAIGNVGGGLGSRMRDEENSINAFLFKSQIILFYLLVFQSLISPLHVMALFS